MAAAWARASRRPARRPDERDPEVRRVRDAGRRRADSNTTRIQGAEAVASIRKLHEAEGGDLVVMGSPTLVRTLLHEGLVDELRLMIEPVILGGGKTIFADDGALHRLELVSTATSGTGVHVCTYRPVAVPATTERYDEN